MKEDESITVESDWLPASELRRLLDEHRAEFPSLAVSVDDPAHRSIDPSVAVAAISGATTLMMPFLAKLAERLFRAKPTAALSLAGDDDGKDVVISAATPADQRAGAIEDALAAGATRIRITIDVSPPP